MAKLTYEQIEKIVNFFSKNDQYSEDEAEQDIKIILELNRAEVLHDFDLNEAMIQQGYKSLGKPYLIKKEYELSEVLNFIYIYENAESKKPIDIIELIKLEVSDG